MKYTLYLIICLGLLFPALGLAASSQLTTPSGPVLIDARSMFRDSDRQIIELTGDVKVVFNNQYISCDKATIYLKTTEIEASGNLIMDSPTAHVEGSHARLNYKTNTGVIYDGFVQSGQVVFQGKVVEKKGPEEYDASEAYYTACTTCPPAWSFSGKNIRAQLGGYAHIKNPVFRVANVPVIWLPWLVVPLKSDRQSGLLIPSMEFSGRAGPAIALKTFWAMSRSQDSTWTAKYYTKRGLKGHVNYRYVLSPDSYGEMNLGGLPDKVFITDKDLLAANPRFSSGDDFTRWFYNYRHYYEMPEGYVSRVKLNLVSDRFYPRDFPNDLDGWGDPALENRVSLARNTEKTHASIDTSYYFNMLTSNPIGANTDSVHRFPELRFSLAEQEIAESGILFHLDADYVNFAREGFAFDDVVGTGPSKTVDVTRGSSGAAGSGTFDPNVDVIRAGQRLDIQPEISYPFRVGEVFDVMPRIGYRHTQYAFAVSPEESPFDVSPYRQYLRAQLETRTRFSRIYGDLNDEKAKRYRHEIEPVVTLTSLPWLEQTRHSFFGENSKVPSFRANEPASNSDFYSDRGIQFDYNDRITNRNVVTLGLNNRLIRKTWRGDEPNYDQIINVVLAQSYDVDEAKKEGHPKLPWSDISALIDMRLERFETNTLLRYFPYHNATNTSSRVRINDDRGNYFQITYTQQFLITENLREDYPNRSESVGLSAGLISKYLNISGGLNLQPINYLTGAYKVVSWSTQANIKPPGDCWGIRANVEQVFGTEQNDIKFSFDFDYRFGG